MARGSLGGALVAGFSAVVREPGAMLLGAVVGVGRGVLTVPATAFAVAVAWTGARFALAGGASPGAAVGAALVALASPRALSILGGLWLAGVLLWGALRMAWIAGVGPLLAWRMAGRVGPAPRFRDGMTARFGSTLVAAGVALVLEVLASGMVVSSLLAALALSSRAGAAPAATAFVSASALSATAFLAALLVAVGDLAIARVALGGETASQAIRSAIRAALRRPAPLVLTLLLVWFAGAVAAVVVQGAAGSMIGLGGGASRMLLFVFQALAGTLAGAIAAGAELWRLATLAAVTLGDQPRPENRSTSLRSESLGIRPPSQ